MDDEYVTVTNVEVPNNARIEKGFSGISEIFTTHYIESKQQSFEYRPIVLTSFAIEYQFFGANPQISHFINIVIYLITCLLLFSVLQSFFKKYTILFPLLVTVLFVVHPIHTEVVASLKNRDELLCFLFGLVALKSALKYIELKNWKYIILIVLSILLSFLSKPTAIMFVVLIPLSIYFFSESKLKSMLHVLLFIFIGWVSFNLMKMYLVENTDKFREYVFTENPLFYESNVFNRVPVAFYSLGYYLKQYIFPFKLSSYYGYSVIPMVGWSSLLMWLSLLLHGFLGVYSILKFRKKTILSFAILIYLLGVIPFSNLLIPVVGIVGDRFVYFASFGFCIIVIYLLFYLFKTPLKQRESKKIKLPSWFYVVVVGIVISFSFQTISRNAKWKDTLTLFRNDSQNFPQSCNLHYMLGNAINKEIMKTPDGVQKNDLINEALMHYRAATDLMIQGVKDYPTDYKTLNNIGTIYMDIFKDPINAQPFFKKSLQINPDNVIVRYDFAYCYEKMNKIDSAIFYYEEIINEKTNFMLVYYQLNNLYVSQSNFNAAIELNSKALDINAKDIRTMVNLGNAYMLSLDTISGVKYFEMAAENAPLDYRLLMDVSNVLKTVGYIDKGLQYENKAKNLNSDNLPKY